MNVCNKSNTTMNKTKTIIATLLLSAGLAAAQTATVNLEWEANPPDEQVTGYRVYQKIITPAPPELGAGVQPAVTWRLIGTAAEPRYAVQGLPAGTVTFAVSAVNAGGEGGRSNEAVATVLAAPGRPEGFRVVTVVVQP